MHIANPIYDVIFKYLMEDAKIAKLIISSIIGEEIKELRFLPQEYITDIDSSGSNPPVKIRKKSLHTLTVYRLDFSAKIKTPEGLKQVIIELQKAKFPTDIMRFRKYLGDQLSNKDNTKVVRINGKSRRVGIPIISIYFLGHKLDNTKAGAIKVSRQYSDLVTGEQITTKEEFIESLTVDSYVIQIPYLTDKRRNDLEILLSVFDQSTAINTEAHILNVSETDFPEKYRPIIRKLQKAVLDNDLKKRMTLEDTTLDELAEKERFIDELEQQVNEEREKNERIKEAAEQEKIRIKVEAELEKEKLKQNAEKRETELLRQIEEMKKLLSK